MATSSMPSNYYCHRCETEVEPNLQDFTCSRCNSGFIEEVGFRNTIDQRNESDASVFDIFRYALGSHYFLPEEPDENEIMDEEEMEIPNIPQSRHSGSRRRGNGSRSGTERINLPFASSLGMIPTRVRVTRSDNPFLLQFLSGFDNVSDIRNYALNHGMFDNLITFLMNQLQVGPPPASDAAIAGLPVLEMTEELVTRHKACSICFDDFQISERCTRLPCQHIYHTSCVNTWLKQHATCPVCRKDLTGRDTSRMEDTTPTARMDTTGSGPSSS